MGNHSLIDIWHRALVHLAQRMDDPSLESWLSDTRPIGVDHDVLLVQFPNAFTRDWVEARYAAILEEAVHHLTGQALQLRFVLADEVTVPRNGGAFTPSLEPAVSSPFAPQRRSAAASSRYGSVGTITRGLAPVRPPKPALQPRYTFETFVVGPGNRFPHAAALAVAEAPGEAYNPLFLYGGVGLGKTHLMQAIGHRVHEHSPYAYVMYVTSEAFTNDLIQSITRKSMESFRNRYRNVDVLLIDDIQFIAGKETTQEEFFHTFNALYEANKQSVLTSDRPPKDIHTLEERLRSRFEWGLTADLQMPDFETRLAILQGKAANANLAVPREVLAYLAERIQSNVRELEGALIKVMALANTHRQPITLDLAVEALKDMASVNRPAITIAAIQQAVADHYGISLDDLKSRRRHREVTVPRQLAMYLARELTDASFPRIGQEFGGRDHSTVLHAYERIRARIEHEPSLADVVRAITHELEHRDRTS